MKFRKIYKPSGNPAEVQSLSEALRIEPLIAMLLVQRGITTYEQARNFFRPSLEQLNNPYLMKDMEKAVERIERSVSSGERILVYGDYDVDGTTGVALFYHFLKNFYPEKAGLTPDVDFYIPDRYTEGYGVSFKGVDYAGEKGCSLIVAVDCGIKSVDKINYAKEKNIDFIVCDHHLPGEILPPAIAVLDPKQAGCNYPFKELTGCGIAFKLAHAIAIKHNQHFNFLEPYLDLVALSITADIVPMVDENRILVYWGLKRMNEKPRPGILALKEVGGIRGEITSGDAVFVLAPRINAAGRIDSGKKAVEMLLSGDVASAGILAKDINEDNTERKGLDAKITKEALEMIEREEHLIGAKSTVLFHPQWHKGVIGIVASRLIEKYYRPTIMLTQSNGTATGSARSIRGFDIHEALEQCSDLLVQFGGHKYAAGLTLKIENVERFQNRFEEVVSLKVTEEMLTPPLEIDAVIPLTDITARLFGFLRQFGPFGPGNMKPVFETRHVFDKGFARIVSADHLKLKINDAARPALKYDAIAFGQADALPFIRPDIPLNLCYTIDSREWMGQQELQLKVKHIEAGEKD